jgi:microcystin degradation protein MlrC
VKRILVAECKQEVSTFNPHPSGYDDFDVRVGTALFDYHRAIGSEVGGVLSVLEKTPGVEPVATYGACFITSGGPLAADAWGRIEREFVSALGSAPPADGVIFCMHGAMASVVEADPEGRLLEEARRVLGERIPIVVSLDLHGILAERMVRHADAIVAYHTYPHVDFFETGRRATRLLLRILDDGVRPVTAVVRVPALVRGNELITETGAFGEVIRRAQRVETGPGGLSAGMFIGNPFTDVPELATYAFVVTDGDPARAEQESLGLARDFWEVHERMTVPLVSLAEMTRIVTAHADGGTIGLVDAADATSSGASGDSNAVVGALLTAGYSGRVLAPIVDQPAVMAAFAAGVGSEVEVSLGGTLDPVRFQPLPTRARVRLLADGRFRSESFGEEWNAGPTAVLESGSVTWVVGSRAVSLYDRSFFLAHGQDPRRCDAVVIKSPHCQHHMYAAWCARMIDIDAPGSSSANLRSLGHARCSRPIFPLDPDVHFTPVARVFARSPHGSPPSP